MPYYGTYRLLGGRGLGVGVLPPLVLVTYASTWITTTNYDMIPIESLRTIIFHYQWADYSDPITALDNYLLHHIRDDLCWKLLPRQVLTYRLAQLLSLRGRYMDAMGWLARSTTDRKLPGWDNMVYLTSYYLDGEVMAPPTAPTPCDNIHICWRMYWLGRQGVWDYREVWPEGVALLGGRL